MKPVESLPQHDTNYVDPARIHICSHLYFLYLTANKTLAMTEKTITLNFSNLQWLTPHFQ